MTKKERMLVATIAVAAIIVVGFAGYQLFDAKHGSDSDRKQSHHSAPMSMSGKKQLIVDAGVRMGLSDDSRDVYADTLLLADFFVKEKAPVSLHTEWGMSSHDLKNKTKATQLQGLGAGEPAIPREYTVAVSDMIPASELESATQYFYQTVVEMNGKTYRGPIESFTTLK